MRLPFLAATYEMFAEQGADFPGAALLLCVGAIVVEDVARAVRAAPLVDGSNCRVEGFHAVSLALELDVVHFLRDLRPGRRDRLIPRVDCRWQANPVGALHAEFSVAKLLVGIAVVHVALPMKSGACPES